MKEVIFTGVAGGIYPELNVGDIVIANDLYQHDMDASPIIPRHEIPLLGHAAIASDAKRRKELKAAAEDFLSEGLANSISHELRQEFALASPKVILGDVGSGDQFVSSESALADLRQRLPNIACVEMEGAAVAQVCEAFHTPFSVIRTISDSADDDAGIDFPRFIAEIAKLYSLGIIKSLLTKNRNG